MPPFKDITNTKFGNLTAVRPTKLRVGGHVVWFCKCDCGGTALVDSNRLDTGNTKSCGCLTVATHGLCDHPLYDTWKGIKRRCYNPKCSAYPNYGARGIEMYKPWRDEKTGLLLFIEYIGPKPSPEYSIDRINNNGNYEPGNVKWSTRKEQQSNKRTNVFVTYKGETKTASEWDRICVFKEGLIARRIRLGWSSEDSIETGVRRRHRNK